MTDFQTKPGNVERPRRLGSATLLSIAGAVVALALAIFVFGSTAAHRPAAGEKPSAALYGP